MPDSRENNNDCRHAGITSAGCAVFDASRIVQECLKSRLRCPAELACSPPNVSVGKTPETPWPFSKPAHVLIETTPNAWRAVENAIQTQCHGSNVQARIVLSRQLCLSFFQAAIVIVRTLASIFPRFESVSNGQTGQKAPKRISNCGQKGQVGQKQAEKCRRKATEGKTRLII